MLSPHLLICPPLLFYPSLPLGTPLPLSSNAALCSSTFCILLRPTWNPPLSHQFSAARPPPSHPDCLPSKRAAAACHERQARSLLLHSSCPPLPADLCFVYTIITSVPLQTLWTVTLKGITTAAAGTETAAKLGCRGKARRRAAGAHDGQHRLLHLGVPPREHKLLGTELTSCIRLRLRLEARCSTDGAASECHDAAAAGGVHVVVGCKWRAGRGRDGNVRAV